MKKNDIYFTNFIFVIIFNLFILVSPTYAIPLQATDLKSNEGLMLFNKAKEAIDKKDYDTSYNLYLKAIPLLEDSNDIAKYCEAYIEVGVMLHWKNEIDKAIRYYLKAKKAIEKNLSQDSYLYGICLLNLSSSIYDKRDICLLYTSPSPRDRG